MQALEALRELHQVLGCFRELLQTADVLPLTLDELQVALCEMKRSIADEIEQTNPTLKRRKKLVQEGIRPTSNPRRLAGFS